MEDINNKDYTATFINGSNGKPSMVNVLIKTAEFADKVNSFCGTKLIAENQDLVIGMETFNKIIKSGTNE